MKNNIFHSTTKEQNPRKKRWGYFFGFQEKLSKEIDLDRRIITCIRGMVIGEGKSRAEVLVWSNNKYQAHKNKRNQNKEFYVQMGDFVAKARDERWEKCIQLTKYDKKFQPEKRIKQKELPKGVNALGF